MKADRFSALIEKLCEEYSHLKYPPFAACRDVAIAESMLRYTRGNSTIRVALSDLAKARAKFRGKRVSSVELRAYMPGVFDSNARPAGHSCNVTLLFTVLMMLRLGSDVEGLGVRGNPYSIKVS